MAQSSLILSRWVRHVLDRYPSMEPDDALYAIADFLSGMGLDGDAVDAVRATALRVYLRPVSEPLVPEDPTAVSPDIYACSDEEDDIIPTLYADYDRDKPVWDEDMYCDLPLPVDLEDLVDWDDEGGDSAGDSWIDDCLVFEDDLTDRTFDRFSCSYV